MSWVPVTDEYLYQPGDRLRVRVSAFTVVVTDAMEQGIRNSMEVPGFSVASVQAVFLTMSIRTQWDVEGAITLPVTAGELRQNWVDELQANDSVWSFSPQVGEVSRWRTDLFSVPAGTAISFASIAILALVVLVVLFQTGVF